LSPDGKRMVFSAAGAGSKIQLWVRSLDALTAQPLAGTEGGAFPFWSPDSQWIGFFAGGKLRKIAASGGPPIALADAPTGRGGTWSPDGVIVFTPTTTSPLYRVSASGGAAVAVTTLDTENTHRWPWFLPDGQHFLYKTGGRIRVGSLAGKNSGVIGGGSGSNAIFSQGYPLFLRDGTLMAQPFDPNALKTTGAAVPLAEQIESETLTGRGVFSASADGLLAFQSGAFGGQQLTWFDRSGKRIGVLGELAALSTLEFSPDRKNAAAAVADQDSRGKDIWVYDVARGLRTRFTFYPGNGSKRCARWILWASETRRNSFPSPSKLQGLPPSTISKVGSRSR
jgi:hypothetical protein